MARDASKPLGHVVHIERLPEHGVRIWLDGVQLQQVSGWSLIEELRPPSTLTLTIKTDTIVWGAPPPQGNLHQRRTDPSGARVCRTCGEPWPCPVAVKSGAPEGATAVLVPIVDDGLRHFAKVRLGGGRVTPSGKVACETCGEAWTCSTYIRRGEFPPELD